MINNIGRRLLSVFTILTLMLTTLPPITHSSEGEEGSASISVHEITMSPGSAEAVASENTGYDSNLGPTVSGGEHGSEESGGNSNNTSGGEGSNANGGTSESTDSEGSSGDGSGDGDGSGNGDGNGNGDGDGDGSGDGNGDGDGSGNGDGNGIDGGSTASEGGNSNANGAVDIEGGSSGYGSGKGGGHKEGGDITVGGADGNGGSSGGGSGSTGYEGGDALYGEEANTSPSFDKSGSGSAIDDNSNEGFLDEGSGKHENTNQNHKVYVETLIFKFVLDGSEYAVLPWVDFLKFGLPDTPKKEGFDFVAWVIDRSGMFEENNRDGDTFIADGNSISNKDYVLDGNYIIGKNYIFDGIHIFGEYYILDENDVFDGNFIFNDSILLGGNFVYDGNYVYLNAVWTPNAGDGNAPYEPENPSSAGNPGSGTETILDDATSLQENSPLGEGSSPLAESGGPVSLFEEEGSTTLFEEEEGLITLFEESGFAEIVYHSNFPYEPQKTETLSVEKGSTVELEDGSLFSFPGGSVMGWSTVSGPDNSVDYSFGESILAEDDLINLYAVWEFGVWTVNFAQGSNGSFVPGTITEYTDIPNGTKWGEAGISVPTPSSNQGYSFSGWDPALPLYDYQITGNLAYIARYLETYTLTFNSNGGSTIAPFPNVPSGSLLTPPAEPTRAGYVFGGWYKDHGLLTPWVFGEDQVLGNITLYAKWTLVTYTVSFQSNGGSAVSAINNVPSGSTISEPHPPIRDLHIFGGWYKDAGLTTPWNFTSDAVTGNTTLYAKWDSWMMYTVTFVSNGGTSVAPYSNVMPGSSIPSPAPPTRADYVFSGWFKDPSLSQSWNFYTDIVSNNITLYAKWESRAYIVMFASNGGSTVAPTTNVPHGSTISAPSQPVRDGYTFAGWYKDTGLSSTWSFLYDVVTSNITLYAKWEAGGGTYTVSFASNGGSLVAPISGIPYGGTVTPPAPPSWEGYVFGGWFLDPTLSYRWDFFNDIVTGDMVLFAKWTTEQGDIVPPEEYMNPENPGFDYSLYDPQYMDGFIDGIMADDLGTAAYWAPFGAFISDHVAYIIGYPDGSVRPEQNVTRAEVAIVYYRLLTDSARNANWSQDISFSDVRHGAWYANAISVMVQMGILRGYPNGTFNPDGEITRAELAAIASRFAGVSGGINSSYSDVTGHWAEGEIVYASYAGFLIGYPDTTFRPNQPITRAEFVTMVNRMLGRIPETPDDLLSEEMVKWPDNANQGVWYYIAIQEATNTHDHSKKAGRQVAGSGFEHEYWTAIFENRDWLALAKQWETTNNNKNNDNTI